MTSNMEVNEYIDIVGGFALNIYISLELWIGKKEMTRWKQVWVCIVLVTIEKSAELCVHGRNERKKRTRANIRCTIKSAAIDSKLCSVLASFERCLSKLMEKLCGKFVLLCFGYIILCTGGFPWWLMLMPSNGLFY